MGPPVVGRGGGPDEALGASPPDPLSSKASSTTQLSTFCTHTHTTLSHSLSLSFFSLIFTLRHRGEAQQRQHIHCLKSHML
ncbi:hypothetical protein E2C01_093411 [Portunus trituberculatus]|uniref:Uncharacterized protein n=1 Tax=Portunus trituberculatus TaxID=210409 RepID=A0A5B7JIV9_PORTR|nr:hypothetical protein [Portunus trituberculatus]